MEDEKNSRHEKWQAIIKEQEASVLSQMQFCKERNISAAKLGYTAACSNQSRHQQVLLHCNNQALISLKRVRMTLPNGFQCIFPSDLTTTQIKEWITVLLSC